MHWCKQSRLRNKNQQDALFYSQFISIINLYMFRARLLLIIRRYCCVYRMSQEERSVFWEVIISVILSKNVYMNMCPIPNDFHTSCKVH